MAIDNKRALQRQWVHSHEEDTDSELVFRPASHPFPPSRGRTSFELRQDGTYVQREPGPADRPEESTGQWLLEGDRLLLHGQHGRPGQVWDVASAGEDVLRIKR